MKPYVTKRYADLPVPISMKKEIEVPFNLQLFIIPNLDGTAMILKHIKFTNGAKVKEGICYAMCRGQPCSIDYKNQFKTGGAALQHMLERLGGFQVR